MKILFLSVGKKHEANVAGAISDFTERIGHYAPAEWKLIPSGENVESEGKKILGALSERDFVVLLDEQGEEVDSQGLAHFIEKRLNAGTHRLVFIIGGAYGASGEVKERANAVISLSQLTFPHQLVRLILAEQIYRTFTILKGEKYHHAS